MSCAPCLDAFAAHGWPTGAALTAHRLGCIAGTAVGHRGFGLKLLRPIGEDGGVEGLGGMFEVSFQVVGSRLA